MHVGIRYPVLCCFKAFQCKVDGVLYIKKLIFEQILCRFYVPATEGEGDILLLVRIPSASASA